ncbi:hypothetical protein FRB90_009561 [Tulasnella sp. 427]|nr:hypothetical protein FRB90_009561 [Tulasnella sp. 427]
MDLIIILVTSSVSTIRVWAIYQRNTKVLILLILSFLICFVPPIAIVSSAKLLSHDTMAERDAELSNSVDTYISLVSSGDPALVPWQMKRCFVPSLPLKYVGVLIGTMVYESSILAAMMYRMVRDKTKTSLMEAFYREWWCCLLSLMLCALLSAAVAAYDTKNPVSQAYIGSMYFVGIKATLCSHIILRLRSYFSEDPYSDETTSGEYHGHELDRPTLIQASTAHHSRSGSRQEADWTDGPDPRRSKSVRRSRPELGGTTWVATGYPNADALGAGGSTSWLGRSGSPDGATGLSDRVPSDLELEVFPAVTAASNSRGV